MGCFRNALWFLFGGAINELSWYLTDCLWRVTIAEIPFGIQQFKLSQLALMPFGTEVY
ncbi:MAG: YccF domain-containing protein [Blautia sp.]